MDAKERMKAVLDELRLNPADFSVQIGKSRPQIIYDVLSGKTKNLSDGLVKQIISVWPKFNVSWLKTGEGEMLRKDSSVQQANSNIVVDSNFIGQGNGNKISDSISLRKALEEIAAQRKLTEDANVIARDAQRLADNAQKLADNAQQQVARMLSLLERLQQNTI